MAEKGMTTMPEFKELLHDKLRVIIADALPKEKIDEMVRSEWDAYFSDTEYRNGKKSPFREMMGTIIQEELKKSITEKVKERVATAIQHWEQNSGVSQMIGDVVEQAAPFALRSMAKDMAGEVIRNMQGRL